MWSECRLIPQPSAHSAEPIMCLIPTLAPPLANISHPCRQVEFNNSSVAGMSLQGFMLNVHDGHL